MKDFRKLKVWQKSHAVTLEVYRRTKAFPKEELFGLTSQMRRAASSISANLAEGCDRSGDAELARFVAIALGSASELEYHCLLAHDLDLLKGESYEKLRDEIVEVKRMLASLFKKLKADCR